jgi:PPK2 family polyphosphate:nucleotide phosphotransferase
MRDDLLVAPGGEARLAARSTNEKFGLDKAEAERRLGEHVERLRDLHVRLWAEHKRSVLLVLQGMDASGKDGTIKRVFTGLNPQGCRVVSFKAPAGDELEHDYLWRIHNALPIAGDIGIFNRSHYEDVVTTRVLGIIGDRERKRRTRHITEFERMLVDEGTTIVKVFLHLGKDEQRKRLQKRLADPLKRWKFRLDDLETRKRWDEYMALYDETITATSTEHAPWYVVPADHKWVSGLLVAELLADALDAMNPQIPPPHDDLDGVTID